MVSLQRTLTTLAFLLGFQAWLCEIASSSEPLDFIDQNGSHGAPVFRSYTKVPIGIYDKTIHYTILPKNRSFQELQTVIAIKRKNVGLSPFLKLNELEELLYHAKWQTTSEELVHSPVPGYIKAIYAKIGQTVNVGTHLATVEIMKMLIDIRANRAGVVNAIECRPGTNVEKDSCLVRLLPTEEDWENVEQSKIEQHKDALISLFSRSDDDPSDDDPSGNFPPPIKKIPFSSKLKPSNFNNNRLQITFMPYMPLLSPSFLVASFQPVDFDRWVSFTNSNGNIRQLSLNLSRLSPKEKVKTKPNILPQASKTKEHKPTYSLIKKPNRNKPPLLHFVKSFLDESLSMIGQGPRISIYPLFNNPIEAIIQGIIVIILLSLVFQSAANELKRMKVEPYPKSQMDVSPEENFF